MKLDKRDNDAYTPFCRRYVYQFFHSTKLYTFNFLSNYERNLDVITIYWNLKWKDFATGNKLSWIDIQMFVFHCENLYYFGGCLVACKRDEAAIAVTKGVPIWATGVAMYQWILQDEIILSHQFRKEQLLQYLSV